MPLVRRVRALDSDLAANRAALIGLVRQDTPQLLELTEAGAGSAASVLIACRVPAGRARCDAALASLAGTCPIPASSGNPTRHHCGGDRRLNRALTTPTIARMRVDPATRAYAARRRAEGRTTKEIMRCRQRYITRQLFRSLATAHPMLAATWRHIEASQAPGNGAPGIPALPGGEDVKPSTRRHPVRSVIGAR